MSFLSLSPELIEEIASHLRAQDIATFVLCCRRFHAIVQGSLLLQYACRAERAGAYDPLWGLSRRPIVDRMETLRRWEASWGDLGRYLAAAPRLVIPAERDLFGPYFLCDDYLFAVDWQGHLPDSRQPALLYVDLRDALRTGQHRWKQIDYPRGSIAITQAFSIEEDDLVVSVISLPQLNNAPPKTILRFMSLETGGVHPSAKEGDLQLDTELSVSLLDVRADVIGDQIVLVLVDLRPDNPKSDAIYLVDWKQGRMTLVHRAPNGTYEGALAVLSHDLVLFLKRDAPSIELCRVTSPSEEHGGAAGAAPSLRVLRTLALPEFHPDYRVHTAYMQTDRHSERRRDLQVLPRRRHPAPLTFHSAPEDMVVGITFLLRLALRGHPLWKKVVTTISHRALFELAAAAEDDDADVDGDGEFAEDRREDGSGGGREGDEELVRAGGARRELSWEEWGPRAARVISPPSFQWITAHAGQRWLSLEADKLVLRDFSAARVHRARARASASTSDTSDTSDSDAADGRGALPRLAPPQTYIPGGRSCFKDDVVSELPFLEMRVDTRARAQEMVLTDGERLVAFVRAGQPPTFEVYVLEDLDDADENKARRSSESRSSDSGSCTTPRSQSPTRGGKMEVTAAPTLANGNGNGNGNGGSYGL